MPEPVLIKVRTSPARDLAEAADNATRAVEPPQSHRPVAR